MAERARPRRPTSGTGTRTMRFDHQEGHAGPGAQQALEVAGVRQEGDLVAAPRSSAAACAVPLACGRGGRAHDDVRLKHLLNVSAQGWTRCSSPTASGPLWQTCAACSPVSASLAAAGIPAADSHRRAASGTRSATPRRTPRSCSSSSNPPGRLTAAVASMTSGGSRTSGIASPARWPWSPTGCGRHASRESGR